MKKILIIFFIGITSVVSATKYYVSSSTGNDGSNGLSEGSAWKTISKVNSGTFLPGDIIALKKGDVWRETLTVSSSGNAGSYITYTSYGTGSNPAILGSEKTGTWTNVSGNIWQSSGSYLNPYIGSTGDLYFIAGSTSSVTFGKPQAYSSGFSNLVSEYDWTWNANTLYVFSPSNPGTRYSSIEAGQRESCIYLNGKQYITIDGIDMFYAEQQGVMEKEPAGGLSGYILRNCEIAYLGAINGYGYGSRVVYSYSLFEYNNIHDCGRRGISLYNYSASKLSNIIIQYNKLYNGNHTTGIDIGAGTSGGRGSTDSIIIRNNLIYDDPGSRAYAHQIFVQNIPSSGTTVTGLYIYDNIFKYPPAASILLEGITESYIYNNTFYGHNNVTTTGSFHIWVDVGSKNATIKNNIFYSDLSTQTGGSGLEIYCLVDPSEVHADYNLYYRVADNLRIVQIGSTTYTRTTSSWSALKAATGWEIHGPAPADPTFVTATDYHLKSGSPAIGAGIAIPMIGADFEGSPECNPPDLGCFSTTLAAPIVPEYSGSVVENATPSFIDLSYMLSLDNITPALSAFTVQVNSTARSVSSVNVSGNKVRLTLTSPIVSGDIIKVSYTKPLLNPLQTSSGGMAASFTLQAVTNNVLPVSPVYVSSVIENAAAAKLNMTFNLTLASIVPDVSAFSVQVNAVNRSISSVSVSGTTVTLNLASPVNQGDVVQVSYTKPLVNPIQTTSGGQAGNLSLKPVINNVLSSVPPANPLLVSSVITNDAPDMLILTFDLSLAMIIPPVSSFRVVINGYNILSVRSITIEDNTLFLKISRRVKPKDKVSVSYTKPPANVNSIQTLSGLEAASFSNVDVTNKVFANFNHKGDMSPFEENVIIYPNPAHGYMNISFGESYISPILVRIINSAGALVSEEIIDAGNNSVQISLNYPPGIYFVRFLMEGVNLGTQKLILQ